jgi:curved DNA-binding protein CbpA
MTGRVTIPDPYKVLQVDPEAEDEVIEAAYRRLARKYHPDVSPDPESEERMVRINQAWELLRDPQRRAAVDRARHRATGAAGAPDPGPAAAATSGGEHRTRTSGPPADEAPGGGTPKRDRPEPSRPAPKPDVVSRDWTSGRSTSGSRYTPDTAMAQGDGAAGPPPGNPSGSVMNFGRYMGWSLGEIARTDLEYIEWLDRTPIGRSYQAEIDVLLRLFGRRSSAASARTDRRGLFRRG